MGAGRATPWVLAAVSPVVSAGATAAPQPNSRGLVMAVKCMFYVAAVTRQANGVGIVKATPVAKGPYAEWSQWTPSGLFEITSLNPAATEWFESMLGKDVSIVIDEAPAEVV